MAVWLFKQREKESHFLVVQYALLYAESGCIAVSVKKCVDEFLCLAIVAIEAVPWLVLLRGDDKTHITGVFCMVWICDFV